MQIETLLARNPLFKGVESDQLRALVGLMQRQTYKAGVVLFEKGDPGETLFVIVAGRARIFMRDAQDNEIDFRIYESGDIFGEFSLLDEQPRSAAVAALEDLDVFVLQRVDFLHFIESRPIVGLMMMRSLAERIRYTTLYLEKIIDWTQRLKSGAYQQLVDEIQATPADEEMQSMIAAFLSMVQTLQRHTAPPADPVK
jgi:CRP-like cAMP-binding protein